jgi:hypothetical protein
MFSNTPSTNAPVKYRTNNTFATTFTGPIKRPEQNFDVARNEAMAQAAFQGNQRAFNKPIGQQGIGAGSKMQAYRSGMQADAEAAKGYAAAQQQTLEKFSEAPTADLQFQERLSGERGWVRDLLLDRDETRNRERMSSYKRFVDVNLGDYERKIKESIAAQRRQTEILGGLL